MNNKIQNIFLLTLISTISTSFADYTYKIPLEQSSGGNLPSGSIILKQIQPVADAEGWFNIADRYIGWNNIENPFNCSSWLPLTNPVAESESFIQTGNDCLVSQVRTVYKTQENNVTGHYRTVGSPTTEYRNLTDSEYTNLTGESITRINDNGFSLSWNDWAIQNSIDSPTNWSFLLADNKSFSRFPTDPYPLSSGMFLTFSYNPNIEKIGNAFLNIESAVSLDFGFSNINDISGLSNLKNTSYLDLQSNKISNLNSLSNLTNVGTLMIQNNPLTNIDGIANLIVGGSIYVDPTYNGNKLPANSIFCLNNNESKFYANFATKDKLCL